MERNTSTTPYVVHTLYGVLAIITCKQSPSQLRNPKKNLFLADERAARHHRDGNYIPHLRRSTEYIDTYVATYL